MGAEPSILTMGRALRSQRACFRRANSWARTVSHAAQEGDRVVSVAPVRGAVDGHARQVSGHPCDLVGRAPREGEGLVELGDLTVPSGLDHLQVAPPWHLFGPVEPESTALSPLAAGAGAHDLFQCDAAPRVREMLDEHLRVRPVGAGSVRRNP